MFLRNNTMRITRIFKNLKSVIAMPGGKTTRHDVILVFFTIISIILAALFIPFRLNLVIEMKDNRLLHSWDIKPQEKFVITYLHSVNKSPVEEYFLIENNHKLLLTKTAFRSFGVGIPCELEPGEEMYHYPDHIEIVKINRELPQILLAVGTVANHQITVHGKVFKLTDFARPQQTVRIYARRVSAYQLIRRGVSDRE